MVYRVVSLSLAAVALALLAGLPAKAADKAEKGAKANTHEGTVVRVEGDKLVMKGKAKDGAEGKEHTHTLSDNAKVTCDGKACKLTDLKAGQRVRVTTKKDDKSVAVRVEALDKQRAFSRSGREGGDKPRGSDKE